SAGFPCWLLGLVAHPPPQGLDVFAVGIAVLDAGLDHDVFRHDRRFLCPRVRMSDCQHEHESKNTPPDEIHCRALLTRGRCSYMEPGAMESGSEIFTGSDRGNSRVCGV